MSQIRWTWDIKELLTLEPTELLTHPKVVEAWWGMAGKTRDDFTDWPDHWCRCSHCRINYKDGDKKFVMPRICDVIEKVAFDMRDACDRDMWVSQLEVVCDMKSPTFEELYDESHTATPKHWVIAATVAYWENKK